MFYCTISKKQTCTSGVANHLVSAELLVSYLTNSWVSGVVEVWLHQLLHCLSWSLHSNRDLSGTSRSATPQRSIWDHIGWCCLPSSIFIWETLVVCMTGHMENLVPSCLRQLPMERKGKHRQHSQKQPETAAAYAPSIRMYTRCLWGRAVLPGYTYNSLLLVHLEHCITFPTWDWKWNSVRNDCSASCDNIERIFMWQY